MSEHAKTGSFWRELRRRNVFKVAMVYLIASWLLIQIAETTFPALQLPDWTVTFVVVVLAILFPIAVIFAWAFELTPEGLKRTGQVDPSESITGQTGQRMNHLIIGALVLAVVVLVMTHGGFGPDQDDAVDDAATTSIAVLPFVNMSDDKGNEFFSDGLSEELLNVLAQVDGLRVAARTSSFSFKGSNEDLRDVASQLGVEHVLEGSVRKSGNRIRATAQLIKADDGFHLWSETFDYEVDDIFKIQDEIALAVVDALKVNLLGEERERLTRRSTTSVEAHNLYLRGRQFLHLRTQESLQQARTLFQRAVQMDPGYALAYSGLSDSIQLLSSNHALISIRDADAESRPLLTRAVALDPESAEVWASTGLMEMHVRNTDAAAEALERAIELNPSYAAGYLWYASLRSSPPYNDDEGALEIYRKVLTIDPLSRVAQQNVGATLLQLGRIDEAEAEFRRGLTLDPDYSPPYVALANIAQNFRYRLDDAHRWYLKAYDLEPMDLQNSINLPVLYRTLGMVEEYDEWTTRLYREAPTHPIAAVIPTWRAMVELDFEAAEREIERARAEGHAFHPILLQMECSVLQYGGRAEEMLPTLRKENPELFASPPVVSDFNSNGLEVCALDGLLQVGETDAAAALAAEMERYGREEISQDANSELYLARLDLTRGQAESAVEHLRKAVDAGWVGSFAWALSIRQDPLWAPIVDRPEVAAIADRLEAELAIQREAVVTQLEQRGVGSRF
jgi:TolB-like protein/Flp pilus assembly protein TadD